MSAIGRASDAITVARLVDLEAAGHDRAGLARGIAQIFRATAARWPTDDTQAAAFQYLWLEQYLEHDRDLVFVARSAALAADAGGVVGYLAGCRTDPATSPRFDSLAYFREFAALCAVYPAHLHVNVAANHRDRRIGERLVAALCAQLAAEGVPGIHVVTGSTQRNLGFYARLGFVERGRARRGAGAVVFLARSLSPQIDGKD